MSVRIFRENSPNLKIRECMQRLDQFPVAFRAATAVQISMAGAAQRAPSASFRSSLCRGVSQANSFIDDPSHFVDEMAGSVYIGKQTKSPRWRRGAAISR